MIRRIVATATTSSAGAPRRRSQITAAAPSSIVHTRHQPPVNPRPGVRAIDTPSRTVKPGASTIGDGLAAGSGVSRTSSSISGCAITVSASGGRSTPAPPGPACTASAGSRSGSTTARARFSGLITTSFMASARPTIGNGAAAATSAAPTAAARAISRPRRRRTPTMHATPATAPPITIAKPAYSGCTIPMTSPTAATRSAETAIESRDGGFESAAFATGSGLGSGPGAKARITTPTSTGRMNHGASWLG